MTTSSSTRQRSAGPADTHGRIAVFAFCSRSDVISGISGIANAFAEIDSETFMPGHDLRASTLLQLNKNIREAVCSPEFFGPANYHDGATIPIPTSALDGYVYSRARMAYVWDWAHTTPQTRASTIACRHFSHPIDSNIGLVSVKVFRLPTIRSFCRNAIRSHRAVAWNYPLRVDLSLWS